MTFQASHCSDPVLIRLTALLLEIFDEEYGETNFVDSVNGYVGEAVLVDCVDVTLQTLAGSSFDTSPKHYFEGSTCEVNKL